MKKVVGQFYKIDLPVGENRSMMKFKHLLTVILPITLLAVLAACSSSETAPGGDILAPLPTNADGEDAATQSSPDGGSSTSQSTLLELLSEDPDLVFFFNGVSNVGLADELQGDGPFTVFAASNVAFSRSGLIVSQMDPAVLGPVLDNHLVEGAYLQPELLASGSVATLNGNQLSVAETDGQVTVNYALLANEPVQASNGVLYVIDTLLLPPETGPEKSMWGVLEADGRFTKFLSILEGTEFMTDLRFNNGYDAILAPTDEAFANMPANVVTWLQNNPHDYEFVASFHLLSPDGWPQGTDLTVADMVREETIQTRMANAGSGFGFGFEELTVIQTETGVTIGGAQIVQGDMDATNGIVHAIDTVLIPQALMEHIQ